MLRLHGMMRSSHIFLPTVTAPRSLCWHGDTLVDWVAGGARYALDGQWSSAPVRYGYRFDSAVASPDGRFVVVYEALGTAALLLKEGDLVREFHRSSYHADVYEYPVALTTLPSGRTLLAHCPEEYCKLELEDAETGERLTRRSNEPADFFHSRLQFSRDGRYLVSAGWVWHPLDLAWLVDTQRALEQPTSLDKDGLFEGNGWGADISAAAFGDADQLLLASGTEAFDTPSIEGGLVPHRIGTYSVDARRMLQSAVVEGPAGTLMPVGSTHAVGFYQSPKLLELATGRIVARWPELSTGEQVSSIRGHHPAPPPLALDPLRRRFAVGTDKGIEVIQLSLAQEKAPEPCAPPA